MSFDWQVKSLKMFNFLGILLPWIDNGLVMVICCASPGVTQEPHSGVADSVLGGPSSPPLVWIVSLLFWCPLEQSTSNGLDHRRLSLSCLFRHPSSSKKLYNYGITSGVINIQLVTLYRHSRAATIVLREDNCHFLRVDKDDFNRILRVSYTRIFVICLVD